MRVKALAATWLLGLSYTAAAQAQCFNTYMEWNIILPQKATHVQTILYYGGDKPAPLFGMKRTISVGFASGTVTMELPNDKRSEPLSSNFVYIKPADNLIIHYDRAAASNTIIQARGALLLCP